MQTINFLLHILDLIVFRPLTWPYNQVIKALNRRWRNRMKKNDPCIYIENGQPLHGFINKVRLLSKGEDQMSEIRIKLPNNNIKTLKVFTEDLFPRVIKK